MSQMLERDQPGDAHSSSALISQHKKLATSQLLSSAPVPGEGEHASHAGSESPACSAVHLYSLGIAAD